MRKFVLSLAVGCGMLAATGSLSAQEPEAADAPAVQGQDDQWQYGPVHRYDTPQERIRLREEQKAAQRRMRLAAMRWFGFSPSRPVASPTPFMGVHAPSWVGNGRNPYHWVGGGYIPRAQRVPEATVRR